MHYKIISDVYDTFTIKTIATLFHLSSDIYEPEDYLFLLCSGFQFLNREMNHNWTTLGIAILDLKVKPH